MVIDVFGVTVPEEGVNVNHARPSPNTALAPNLVPAAVVVESVRLCGAGSAAPVTPVNNRPAGCTVLPLPAPAAGTLSTTVTDCGELGTPGAEITTCP